MKIEWMGLEERYRSGMREFMRFHEVEEGTGGLRVQILTKEGEGIAIRREGNEVELRLDDKGRAFRALTLLLQRQDETRFEYAEGRYFDTCGAMFDGSQASSLLNTASCKKLMLVLAGMGFNQMMLYCEDCYEVPGEPYWGNMRPRFSQKDFRELDDYADALGIELVPCIQTLGHLTEAIKRPPYGRLADTSSVLMVDEEETYALIERLIESVSSCFRSRRIHLGLDEAWDLGLGKHLRKYGYETQDELMTRHIARVYEIARRHGLTPMMWADMYFRARSATGDYYDLDVQLTEADRARVPEEMRLIYWDYYHETPDMYRAMIERYYRLTCPEHIVFAGCARNVRTFASHYHKTKITTNPALSVCKQKGVREVFATVWGDDHRESSTFSTLPGLQFYAEHMYHQQPDDEWVKQRFEACTHAGWDAFMDIDHLDAVEGFNGDYPDNLSPTRAILWQDPMLGIMDADLGDFDFEPHYERLQEALRRDAQENPVYADVFTFYAALAGVLAQKAGLGRALYAAYQAGDRERLQALRDSLPALSGRMSELRKAHRAHFFTEYKPVGWEVLDIRYGGALMRLDTTQARLDDYLSGKLDRLEELEEARLSFSGNGRLRGGLNYLECCSASRL